MPRAHFNKAAVRAVEVVVGDVVRRIDEEVVALGGNPKQIESIKKAVGLNERRVVERGVTAMDLCAQAASKILEQSDLERERVNGLVFVTQTPDHFQPCNAALVHGRLGLPEDCAAFDVNLGCSGYVYGLWLAHMLVESGGCGNVLLLAGDTMSHCVNPRDRAVAPLFGDAGSATWVSVAEGGQPAHFVLKSNGAGAPHIVVPAGGFREPSNDAARCERTDADGNVRSRCDLFMDGAEVFNFSMRAGPEAVKEVLAHAKKEASDVDAFLFHQANKYILGNLARRLRLPKEKVPMDLIGKYGNQSSASIPAALVEHVSHRVRASHARCLMAGFGVGLSWGSCLLEVGPLQHCGASVFLRR